MGVLALKPSLCARLLARSDTSRFAATASLTAPTGRRFDPAPNHHLQPLSALALIELVLGDLFEKALACDLKELSHS
jgi:hypothetical protein